MTAVAVELCGCSHAPRMHERDEDAENGRGACMARGGDCGCSEYRPGMVDVEVPDPPVEGAEAEVVEPPPVVAITEPTVTAPLFECPAADCARSFPTPQGLAMHRRRAHEGYDPNRKAEQATETRADADSPSPEPDRPAEAPAAAIPPTAAGDLAEVVKHGLAMVISDDDVALLRAAAEPSGPPVVDRDVVLIGLVRALQAVMTADADVLVEQALDIQRYMDDRGWRVIDGGPR